MFLQCFEHVVRCALGFRHETRNDPSANIACNYFDWSVSRTIPSFVIQLLYSFCKASLPNVGREGETFMTNAVEAYNTLNDFTLFVNGDEYRLVVDSSFSAQVTDVSKKN